jgi:hypothetical protein
MWPFTRRKRQRRNYASASMSRLTSDWVSQNTSADAEIKNSLRVLRVLLFVILTLLSPHCVLSQTM